MSDSISAITSAGKEVIFSITLNTFDDTSDSEIQFRYRDETYTVVLRFLKDESVTGAKTWVNTDADASRITLEFKNFEDRLGIANIDTPKVGDISGRDLFLRYTIFRPAGVKSRLVHLTLYLG